MKKTLKKPDVRSSKKIAKKLKNAVSAKGFTEMRKSVHSPKVRPKAKESAVFRVNVDFPKWMVSLLDEHCQRLGVTRQSLIKVLIAKCLEEKNVEIHS